jgi:hypothetical protein
MRGLLGDGGSIAQGAMHIKNFLSEPAPQGLMAFWGACDGGLYIHEGLTYSQKFYYTYHKK